mmetsp:Transcript_72194/g.215434  ORF Transcript_72194/g.215434 Transcript_72194/m.215434 type:complete len:229 (+) Transcript_72194:353-1039(+)
MTLPSAAAAAKSSSSTAAMPESTHRTVTSSPSLSNGNSTSSETLEAGKAPTWGGACRLRFARPWAPKSIRSSACTPVQQHSSSFASAMAAEGSPATTSHSSKGRASASESSCSPPAWSRTAHSCTAPVSCASLCVEGIASPGNPKADNFPRRSLRMACRGAGSGLRLSARDALATSFGQRRPRSALASSTAESHAACTSTCKGRSDSTPPRFCDSFWNASSNRWPRTL